MVDLVDYFAIIVGCLSVISVFVNIIQYFKRKKEEQSLRELVQSNYNNFYFVARCCTKARGCKEEDKSKLLNNFVSEMSKIEGIADSARHHLIAYGREHLNFIPFFEHPAFPGEEQPNEVKLGTPPELLNNPEKSEKTHSESFHHENNKDNLR